MAFLPFLPFLPFLSLLLSLPSLQGVEYSVSPPLDAFLLFSHHSATPNHTEDRLFLQNGCPSSTQQSLTAREGGHSSSLPLTSIPSLHCAVSVQVVDSTVTLDRPFVDVVALSDVSLLSFHRRPLCVAVRLVSSTGASIGGSCQLSPFEQDRHSCLIRVQVPFGWFGPIGLHRPKQTLSLSYTVGSTCSESFLDRPQSLVTLNAHVANAQAHTLLQNEDMDISVLSRANVTLGLNSLNSFFVHLSLNDSTSNDMDTLEMRMWLDARLDMVNVAPLSSSDWLIRASSPDRPSLHTSFICTRLNKSASWDGYLFALLMKMRGSVLENRRLERKEEGAEASLHWEIRRGKGTEGTKGAALHRAVIKLRVTPDSVYALVPVAKSRHVINTAVLSGHQASIPMRILSVTAGGVTHDVTALSHCMSAESRVLKTSPTCASVYVDGSEMRGLSLVKVHVHYESWVTDISFTVWYPLLPVTVWMKDVVLNSISGWPVTTWKQLEGGGRLSRSSARQFSCRDRFQQTEVRVLAAFVVVDERTGERSWLSGARDVLFDVSSLVGDRVQSVDRAVASVHRDGERITVVAERKGATSITVNSNIPHMTLGSGAIMITDEEVSIVSLSIDIVTHISVQAESKGGSQFVLHSSVNSSFTHKYQQGSLSVSVEYSDGAGECLSSLPPSSFSLLVHSTEERGLAVKQRSPSTFDLIAIDSLPAVSVVVELRPPPECIDPDALPLSLHSAPIYMAFGGEWRESGGLSSPPPPFPSPLPPTEGWRLDTLLLLAVVVVGVLVVVKALTSRGRPLNGYEKLVAPLLSRLSTSVSGGRTKEGEEEEEKEWVWLSKNNPRVGSMGYSGGPSTRPSSSSPPSYDCNTHTSISYRGSEISVFISPQPAVTVNGSVADRENWRAVHSSRSSRVRASSRSRMADSSSEHDLSRPTDYSHRIHTWNNGKRRSPPLPHYEGLRESIA